MIVEWYRHGHEHRNDLLRYGFMRLHANNEIQYREYPLARCAEAGFPDWVSRQNRRHSSVIALRTNRASRRIIVDSEDSFFWMSPLVHACDLYFCAGYSSRFFRERRFIEPYDWQTEQEIVFYQNRAVELVREHGSVFGRIQPFIPIGPSMARRDQPSRIVQKLYNLRHRASRYLGDRRDWGPERDAFDARYAELLSYRDAVAEYDIVLQDSLWGWPRHRVALHNRLAELSKTYAIHARLTWSDPVPFDASDRSALTRDDFPMRVGSIDDYESMLARSRLAVFATGFHWGWRNIMTLALLMGLPVFVDRLVLEPWFDINELGISSNESFGFSGLAERMAHILPSRSRKEAVAAYDARLAPEVVARHTLSVAEKSH